MASQRGVRTRPPLLRERKSADYASLICPKDCVLDGNDGGASTRYLLAFNRSEFAARKQVRRKIFEGDIQTLP